jgi:hypothetical protein
LSSGGVHSLNKLLSDRILLDIRSGNLQERKECDLSINKKQNTQKCNELMIWYTNATSLNNKINELRLQIEIFEPDVICVTETWFKAESDVNINNYNIYRTDRKTHGGGVCIYVKQCINHFETNISQLNENYIEQIWACLCLNNQKILIGCTQVTISGEISASSHEKHIE